ncbi:MAG TPA: glycosyltransferase family 39 protein [bacterium]
MAALSWYRWPEAIVDYGRELYVPWRIDAGEMLYRDIPHLYGPLAQYGNALLFTLFGTGLRTLVTFNLLLIAALSVGIYVMFRRVYDRLTATLCGMVFLGVFAFGRNTGQGNWNFVCPYSHEVTYGVFLSFALLVPLAAFHTPGERRWAGGAGFLLGLIFLTKVEVFVAAAAAAVVVVGVPVVWTRSLRPTARGRLLLAAVCFMVPLLGFAALFACRTTVADAAGMLATTVTSLGRGAIVRHPFYLNHAGLDEPLANTGILLAAAAIYGVILLGVLVLGRFVARRGGLARNRLLVAGCTVVLCVTAYLLRDRTELWSRVGRPIPLFVAAHSLWLLRRRGEAAADDGGPRSLLPLALSTFGLFLLLKIILRVQFRFYGFALALPATLVTVAGAVHHWPRYVQRRGGSAGTARVVMTALVLVSLVVHAGMSWDFYRRMTYPVGTGADRFYTYGPEVSEIGPVMSEALRAIEDTMPRAAGFVVLPEGVMLNYLSRRRNPARWFEFTPQYLASVGEERMRDDLEAARPDYVVLAERPTPEHGFLYFGNDYGLKLRDWITQHYTPVFLAGSKVFSNQGFGIAIGARNAEPR